MSSEFNPWLPHGIALLVGLIPLLVYYLTSRKKVLGYAVTRNAPIITIKEKDHAQNIEIRYAGRLVQDLRSIQVLIQNIGVKDIESQSVDLVFPSSILLMNWQMSFNPPTLQRPPTVQVPQANHLRIILELMNPGDNVTLNALTAHNETGDLRLDARGVNLKFKKFDPTYFVSPAINRVVLAVCILSCLEACCSIRRLIRFLHLSQQRR